MSNRGDYPWGAEYDSRAPWNEKNDYDLIVDLDYFGEVILIQRTHIDENDWEDDTRTIDAAKMNKYLAEQLHLDLEAIEEGEKKLDILEIKELKNKSWNIITSNGNINTSFVELENLL